MTDKLKKQITEAEQATFTATKALSDLRAFMAENADVVTEFVTLVAAAEAEQMKCKAAMQALPSDSSWEYNDYKKNRGAVKVEYTATKVPKSVLALPGVIKTVDTKMIEKHLESSPLSAEDRAALAACRTEKVSAAVCDFPVKLDGLTKLLENLV